MDFRLFLTDIEFIAKQRPLWDQWTGDNEELIDLEHEGGFTINLAGAPRIGERIGVSSNDVYVVFEVVRLTWSATVDDESGKAVETPPHEVEARIVRIV
jgi:hypothetical protein